MFVVYILKSEKVIRYYVGVTRDLEQRLRKHNNGSSPSTKPHRPWRTVYTEEYNSAHEAYKRESFLKSNAGYLEKGGL